MRGYNNCAQVIVQLGIFGVSTFSRTPLRFPLWTGDHVLSGGVERDWDTGVVWSPRPESTGLGTREESWPLKFSA